MRRADIDGEQSVEILDREVLDRSRLRDPGVGHQASRSPINHEPGRRACAPVGRDEIGRDGVGTAAGRADLIDHRLRQQGNCGAQKSLGECRELYG
jgi:hypothetical protein